MDTSSSHLVYQVSQERIPDFLEKLLLQVPKGQLGHKHPWKTGISVDYKAATLGCCATLSRETLPPATSATVPANQDKVKLPISSTQAYLGLFTRGKYTQAKEKAHKGSPADDHLVGAITVWLPQFLGLQPEQKMKTKGLHL